MINSFHMNPWLYLLTIPICAVIILSQMFGNTDALYTRMIISSVVILSLLLLLYMTNIIGLYDLLMLLVIFFIIIYPGIFIFTMYFNIILIPLAIGLSLHFRK